MFEGNNGLSQSVKAQGLAGGEGGEGLGGRIGPPNRHVPRVMAQIYMCTMTFGACVVLCACGGGGDRLL